jgi:hypothetical protein
MFPNIQSASQTKTSFQRDEKILFPGRSENIINEQKLNAIRMNYENLLQEKKQELANLLNNVCHIQQEIHSMQMDEEVIDKLAKFLPKDEIKKVNVKNSSEKGAYDNMVHKINRRKIENAQTLKEEILEKIEEKTIKREKIESLNREIEKYSLELKMTKSKLVDHYHALLKEGRDSRGEGLIWILKEIISLGSNVKLSCMPNFLDETSILYLFKYTKLDLELRKVIEEKTKLKMRLKKKKEETRGGAINKFLFKTSISKLHNKKNSNDLRMLNNSSEVFKDIYENYLDSFKKIEEIDINFKNVKDLVENKVIIEKETLSLLRWLEAVEQKENDYRRVLSEMKMNEMNRIFKEFTRNDYERRFNVNKAIVVSALIGEDYTTAELIRQQREYKVSLLNDLELYGEIKTNSKL